MSASSRRGKKRQAFWVSLRNAFLAGVAIVLPIAVTAWLIWTFVALVDETIFDLLPAQFQSIAGAAPGIGVIIALVALTLIGALTASFAGQWLLHGFEALISNLPVIRSIYGGSKQIFQQVAAPDRTSFKETVLVPYPHPGAWAIGFITNEETEDVTGPASDPNDPLIAVFLPMSPIPTGGFLVYYPRSAIKRLDIGPEEALKRVISFGIVKDDEFNGHH